MRTIRWIIIVVVLAAIGGGAYLYLKNKNQASPTANLITGTVTRGTITQVVSSSGSVRSKQSAELDWQTTGEVGTVNVQVGQKVQAGQVLAKLDPTTVSPSVLNAQQTLVTAKDNLQTLENSTQSQLTITQDQQALANAQSAYTTAKDALSALQGKTNANATTIKQDQADLEIAQANLHKLQSKFGNLTRIKPTNVVKANKVLKLTAAQQQVDTAQYNLDWAQGHASANDLAVAQGNLAVAQSQLQDAKNAYDQAVNGPSADALAAAQAAVDAAQSTVNEVSLTAPISGTVTAVDIMPGDMVSAGTAGFQIDDLSGLYVDVVASEVDINKIQIGQPVDITFTAIQNKTYHGKVTSVGIIGTSTQGVVNFPVTVQITDPNAQVKSGMSAVVNINVLQHTNALLVPNQAVRTVGSQHTVTVLFQGQEIQVPVTVGISNNTTTEITNNSLKVGDVVVLNASASSSGNNRGGGPGGFFIRGFGG